MIDFLIEYGFKLNRFAEMMILTLCVVHPITEKRARYFVTFFGGNILIFALYIIAKLYSNLIPEETWGDIGRIFNRDSILTLALDILTFFVLYASYKDSLANLLGKYVVSSFSYMIFISVLTLSVEPYMIAHGRTLTYCIFRYSALFLLVLFLRTLFIKRCDTSSHFTIGTEKQSLLLHGISYFAIDLLHTFSLKIYYAGESSMNYLAVVIHMMACIAYIVILYITKENNKIKEDYSTISAIMAAQKEQYALSSETIEIINRKCHDLKYQIEALSAVSSGEREEMIRELSKAVNIYENIAKTDNSVLNTVLSEKSLLCEEKKIRLTCITSPHIIDFMDALDIYVLFGNAISNAIEYLTRIEAPEKRIISVSAKRAGNMCIIQIDNYFENADTLIIKDGLPETTKPDKHEHGYGMKSIKTIVEKYGGNINVAVSDGIFSLIIGIPLNQNQIL